MLYEHVNVLCPAGKFNEQSITNALIWSRVVQDCEHEGTHYSLRKNLRAAKRGTPL